MRLYLSLAGVLLASMPTAQAQVNISFGPRLGGNLATATFTLPDQQTSSSQTSSYSRSPILSYQVGLAASFRWGHWVFQPALMFTEKGLKQETNSATTYGNIVYTENDAFTSRVHYLELPLNVVYNFGANGEGFQLFAGPYLAVGAGGQTSCEVILTDFSLNTYTTSSSAAFTFGDIFPDPVPSQSPRASGLIQVDIYPQVRRFDAGINAGVGYRRGPLQVQLGYGLGLLNAQPDYPASYQMPNDKGYLRVAQLTATYYFPTGSK